jgi:hypothetical protein
LGDTQMSSIAATLTWPVPSDAPIAPEWGLRGILWGKPHRWTKVRLGVLLPQKPGVQSFLGSGGPKFADDLRPNTAVSWNDSASISLDVRGCDKSACVNSSAVERMLGSSAVLQP